MTIGNYSSSEICIQLRNNSPERETDFINEDIDDNIDEQILNLISRT